MKIKKQTRTHKQLNIQLAILISIICVVLVSIHYLTIFNEAKISQIIRLAKNTFDQGSPNDFPQKFRNLQENMNNLTGNDLGLDHSDAMKGTLIRSSIIYVGVHEDPYFSASIFILMPGSVIPIHNHPNMHGLIKVIRGQIKITAFTKQNLQEVDLLSITQDTVGDQEIKEMLPNGHTFPAKRLCLNNVDSTHATIVLYPGTCFSIVLNTRVVN